MWLVWCDSLLTCTNFICIITGNNWRRNFSISMRCLFPCFVMCLTIFFAYKSKIILKILWWVTLCSSIGYSLASCLLNSGRIFFKNKTIACSWCKLISSITCNSRINSIASIRLTNESNCLFLVQRPRFTTNLWSRILLQSFIQFIWS